MLELKPLAEEKREWFIVSLQWAFKQAMLDELAENEEIISREEIEATMKADNAQSLQIEYQGQPVAGAVVRIDEQTQRNSLDLFFVTANEHSKGFGLAAWQAIERHYPQTKIWETHTPYFEKRNIHFYVNKCGFKIVEFYHEKNPNPHSPNLQKNEQNSPLDEMFRFEKEMKTP